MIKNLTETAARELLSEQSLGHLGCVLASGEPYVVPVNYLFEDEGIFVHSLAGQKLEALRSNGKVCLQVEKIEKGFGWESAIAFGEFQEITLPNEKLAVLQKFSQRFERLTPVEALTKERWTLGDIIVFCIKINRLTGVAEC